jgi:hypothetical protein
MLTFIYIDFDKNIDIYSKIYTLKYILLQNTNYRIQNNQKNKSNEMWMVHTHPHIRKTNSI